MNSIYGSSFIPSNFIPKGMEIYATMKVLELPKDVAFSNAMTSDIPIALPWEGILSVKAESFNEVTSLRFMIQPSFEHRHCTERYQGYQFLLTNTHNDWFRSLMSDACR